MRPTTLVHRMAIARVNTVFEKENLVKLIHIATLLAVFMGAPAIAAPCGDTSAGFDNWKPILAAEAKAEGVGKRGIAALLASEYSKTTISADRNQKSFKYSLEKFMALRGADTIVALGRKRKAKSAEFYANLEARFGVPAGVILAIHGMETGFGNFMGDTNVVSAIATLTWDCRRSDFFRPHLIGALKLVDQGTITAKSIGAKHGELGHTQFLPGNALTYGVDGDGDGTLDLNALPDALATTANYLMEKGWTPGLGYQQGEPNFAVIEEWNAATVYQQAIALMGAKIDK
jgi:membrane-bound lytic murein transglycosylase B